MDEKTIQNRTKEQLFLVSSGESMLTDEGADCELQVPDGCRVVSMWMAVGDEDRQCLFVVEKGDFPPEVKIYQKDLRVRRAKLRKVFELELLPASDFKSFRVDISVTVHVDQWAPTGMRVTRTHPIGTCIDLDDGLLQRVRSTDELMARLNAALRDHTMWVFVRTESKGDVPRLEFSISEKEKREIAQWIQRIGVPGRTEPTPTGPPTTDDESDAESEVSEESVAPAASDSGSDSSSSAVVASSPSPKASSFSKRKRDPKSSDEEDDEEEAPSADESDAKEEDDEEIPLGQVAEEGSVDKKRRLDRNAPAASDSGLEPVVNGASSAAASSTSSSSHRQPTETSDDADEGEDEENDASSLEVGTVAKDNSLPDSDNDEGAGMAATDSIAVAEDPSNMDDAEESASMGDDPDRRSTQNERAPAGRSAASSPRARSRPRRRSGNTEKELKLEPASRSPMAPGPLRKPRFPKPRGIQRRMRVHRVFALAEINARNGQTAFRAKLGARDRGCILTGITGPGAMLEAAHLVSVGDAPHFIGARFQIANRQNHTEAATLQHIMWRKNGVLLAAHFHRLLDAPKRLLWFTVDESDVVRLHMHHSLTFIAKHYPLLKDALTEAGLVLPDRGKLVEGSDQELKPSFPKECIPFLRHKIRLEKLAAAARAAREITRQTNHTQRKK